MVYHCVDHGRQKKKSGQYIKSTPKAIIVLLFGFSLSLWWRKLKEKSSLLKVKVVSYAQKTSRYQQINTTVGI
jgi:hypothetical protein